MAIDGFDNLYVGNGGSGAEVTVYAPDSGRPIKTYCTAAFLPSSLAIDALGDLYEASLLSSKVTVFPPARVKN